MCVFVHVSVHLRDAREDSLALSAQFVLWIVLVQQADVGKGEMAMLSLALTLPLTVYIDLGHLHHVADLTTVSEWRKHFIDAMN